MTDTPSDPVARFPPDAVARFPGGRMRPDDWTALAEVAGAHRGDLQLTEKGGIGVRRIGDRTALTRDELAAAGLSPHLGDAGVPHIIASPLAGRLHGHHDLGDLPEDLDAQLSARLDAIGLDARLLIGLDAGPGDVLAHSPDLAVVAGGGGTVRIHVRGQHTSVETTIADAVTVVVDVIVDLVGRPGGESVPADAGGRHDLVVALERHPLTFTLTSNLTSPLTSPGSSTPVASAQSPAVTVPPVGWVDTDDGLVSLLAVIEDGVVPARLAEFLGAVDRPSTISADRVIGLHGLTEAMAEQVVRVLAPMGLIFDASSPWAEPTTPA